MKKMMRCIYCGILQDEPEGAKVCVQCGGELVYEQALPINTRGSYLTCQLALDQVDAPAGQNVERHLLATLQTPAKIPDEYQSESQGKRPAMGFTAVLDVSGSMGGGKIQRAKEALRQALKRVQDGDVLSLVVFSSDVRCVLEPTLVSGQTRGVIESALQEIRAGGMTALCGGLELGLGKALDNQQDSHLVLLLSDGQANVGETDLEKVGYRALEARQKGLVISTLGVGSDYNEALMAEIATQGGGRFYHIQDDSEINAYLTGEMGEMAELAARDVKIVLNIPPGMVLMPLSAAYPTSQGEGKAIVSVGSLPLDLELELPIRVMAPAQKVGSRLKLDGEVQYLTPTGTALKTSLNRVTLRFVETNVFQLRDGAVMPVVERVMEHIKATSVLGYARTAAKDPEQAIEKALQERERVRAYATLLGEERASEEANIFEREVNYMQSAPMYSKQMVSDKHAFVRSSRQFKDQDKS
jgi:Ca-activated chloride channel family protein